MSPPKCTICLSFSSCKEGDYFVNTHCGHLYHFSCVREWFRRSPEVNVQSCPACREPVEFSSLVKLHGMAPVLHVAMEGNEQKYNIKITLLGNSGTGKTSLLHAFTKGGFPKDVAATTGVDMGLKTMHFAGRTIKLTVWDCAGQDRFRAICPSYIRNSHGVILVYDVTHASSFESIDSWLTVVYQYAPDVCILLAGNKCDLQKERQVSTERGLNAAMSSGFDFMETSAKDATNLEAAFRAILGKIVSTLWDDGYIDSFEDSPSTIKLSNEAPLEPPRSSQCAVFRFFRNIFN